MRLNLQGILFILREEQLTLTSRDVLTGTMGRSSMALLGRIGLPLGQTIISAPFHLDMVNFVPSPPIQASVKGRSVLKHRGFVVRMKRRHLHNNSSG